MVTRSEAGGHLPPVLGALSAAVTAKRPDLESLRGHIVRVHFFIGSPPLEEILIDDSNIYM